MVDMNALQNKAAKLRRRLESGCSDLAVKAEYDGIMLKIQQNTPVADMPVKGHKMVLVAEGGR